MLLANMDSDGQNVLTMERSSVKNKKSNECMAY